MLCHCLKPEVVPRQQPKAALGDCALRRRLGCPDDGTMTGEARSSIAASSIRPADECPIGTRTGRDTLDQIRRTRYPICLPEYSESAVAFAADAPAVRLLGNVRSGSCVCVRPVRGFRPQSVEGSPKPGDIRQAARSYSVLCPASMYCRCVRTTTRRWQPGQASLLSRSSVMSKTITNGCATIGWLGTVTR